MEDKVVPMPRGSKILIRFCVKREISELVGFDCNENIHERFFLKPSLSRGEYTVL